MIYFSHNIFGGGKLWPGHSRTGWLLRKRLRNFRWGGRSIKIENDTVKHFVKLGAVSPDLPYLSDPIGDAVFKKHNWADRMHYENTGAFISHGIDTLQLLKYERVKFDKCAAWLCGYASHVVTDTVVHPVVNAIVGAYIFNSGDHRKCEMTQDSLVFNKVMQEELVGSGYHLFLRKCSGFDENAPTAQEHFLDETIKKFWKSVLIKNHEKPSAASHHDDIDPDVWFRLYLAGIGFSRTPNPVFRHIGNAAGVAYLKTTRIPEEHKERYYTNVKMPEGIQNSDFFSVVFSKAVQKTISTWDNLITDIESGDSKRCLGANGYIKNWNLDLGINADDADLWERTA
jgi:hypothetical protein